MTAQEIHDDIVFYLSTHFGSDYKNAWYVGIAKDVEQRLFGEHKVNRNSPDWIWRQASTAQHARLAETMLINRGHDGGSGGGDHTTTYVYAFRKVLGTIR
jgi:hypothetical protein